MFMFGSFLVINPFILPAYLGWLSYLSGGLKASTSDHYVSHDISSRPLDDSFISFSYVYIIYIYIVDDDDDDDE